MFSVYQSGQFLTTLELQLWYNRVFISTSTSRWLFQDHWSCVLYYGCQKAWHFTNIYFHTPTNKSMGVYRSHTGDWFTGFCYNFGAQLLLQFVMDCKEGVHCHHHIKPSDRDVPKHLFVWLGWHCCLMPFGHVCIVAILLFSNLYHIMLDGNKLLSWSNTQLFTRWSL